MSPALKLHLLRYWAAMNASALQSGVHAVVGFGSVASIHALNDSVAALTVPQTAWLFLAAFGHGLLNYLDKHPLLTGPEPAPLPLESLLTPENLAAIARLVHEKQTAGSPAQPQPSATTTPTV